MAYKYLDISNISKAVALALVTSSLSIFPIGQAVKAAGTTPNDGTCDLVEAAANSYSISSTAELREVPDCVEAGNNTFTLETDISLAGVNFPLNDSASPIAFSGILDGGGYAITDISISSSVTQSMGLFTSANNAEFRNLKLTGRVATSSTVIRQLGSLAGLASGFVTVSNVVSSVEASLPSITPGNAAGGIFGRMVTVGGGLNLSNILLTGNVTSGKYVGGVVGEVKSSTVVASVFASSVSNLSSLVSSNDAQGGGLFGNMASVDVTLNGVLNIANINGQGGSGGLIGQISGTKLEIEDATNSGTVTGRNTGTGGLVGNAPLQISASRVSNLGTVDGWQSTGGLFGSGGSATGTVLIKSGFNSAFVKSISEPTGGIVGKIWSSSRIIETRNSGPISSSNPIIGGLVGQSLGAISIEASGNTGSVVGQRTVGGLLGESSVSAEILYSSNSGTVSSTATSANGNAGGLIGVTKTTSFSRVINSAFVRASDRFAGGLIGQILRPAQVTISEAVNTGAVQAKSEAGGIVGGSSGLTSIANLNIENSANYGSVVATTGTASGVIGSATAIDLLNISSSLQVGAVSATSSPTDSIVISPISGTYQATYTNVDSIHVSKQTDTTLQQASSYTGWNFSQIWGFPSCSTNNGFPVLRFAYPGVTFSDQACAGFVAPQQNTGGSSTPTEPTKYSGPELQSLLTPVRPGSLAVFQGYKLNLVYEVVISGSPVASFSTSVTSLEIVVPANLAPGTYDVEVRSEYGRLTALSALTVAEPLVTPVTSSPAPNSKLLRWVWTAKFQGNSVDLTRKQINLIRATKVPAESKTAICWSYTNPLDTNPTAVARATSRAKAVCQLVSKANPKLKVMIRVRAAEDKAQISRTAVQFWK